MKTHELAAALSILVKWLRNSPNTELTDMPVLTKNVKPAKDEVASATALSSLVAFSSFSKHQWAELIATYKIPIEIKGAYSSRDVMGKIMNYFAENSSARADLLSKLEHQPGQVSNELMRALSVLLKN